MSPDRRVLWAVTLLAAAFLAPGAVDLAFHYDETNLLRHVTMFAHGEFLDPGRPGLLFLALVPLAWLDDPWGMMLGGRLVCLLAAAGTIYAVQWHAQRAWGRSGERGWLAAVAAAFLLVSSPNWYVHAFEIRTDSWTTPAALLLGAMLWREGGMRRALAAGVLIAAMGLVSQKSLYPVVAASLAALAQGTVVAEPRWRERFGGLVVAGAVSLALVAVWYFVLSTASGAGAELVRDNLERAADTGWSGRALGSKLMVVGRAIKQAPVLWGLGLLGLAQGLSRPSAQRLPIAVFALLTLSTMFFHRGVFGYYAASFEPALAILAAGPVLALGRQFATRGRVGLAAQAALALALIGGVTVRSRPAFSDIAAVTAAPQRALIEEVQRHFPEPVPYWDGQAAVPGYPEVTFFNTFKSRQRVRSKYGKTYFIDRTRALKPRFFLRRSTSPDSSMQGAELRWHWVHFVPFRDNLYLLGGRRLAHRQTADQVTTFEALLPGPYTVWFQGGWRGTASVDDQPVEHNTTVVLEEGRHELQADPRLGTGQLWLIHGADREPLARPLSDHVDWSMDPLPSRRRYERKDRKSKKAWLLTLPHAPKAKSSNADRRRHWHRRYHQRRDTQLGVPALPE